MPMSLSERRNAFRRLHDEGCFVIPNPWDVGSARALALLGFQALATTSAGFGFSRGLPDVSDALDVDEVIDHVAEIVSSCDLPVSADFQAGYSKEMEGLAINVRRCMEVGVAGLSIEDATAEGLLEMAVAVERVRAARETVDSYGEAVMLTARAECFLVGHPDPLRESIRRLEAYAEAGAHVLFAPGVTNRDDIAAIVKALHPLPVNVLMSSDTGLRVADLAELGVRRISVGSALARVAWGGFLSAARQLASEGSFAGLKPASPFSDLNAMFTVRNR